MKYLLSSLQILCVAILCVSCKPSAQQIMQTADSLHNAYLAVTAKYQLLSESYETYQAADMDAAHTEFAQQIQKSTQSVQNLEIVEGCESLAQVVKKSLEVYSKVCNEDSREQIRIYKIDDANFGDDLRNKWDAIALAVETKTKNADAEVEKVYSELKNTYQKAK